MNEKLATAALQALLIGVIVLLALFDKGGWATFFAVLLVLSCL